MNKPDGHATLPSALDSRRQSAPAGQANGASHEQGQQGSLRTEVEKSLLRYFQHLGDEPVSNLYQMVMSEVEAPLLEAVLRHTRYNQSRSARMLGLSRGTLRTKLKRHGLL